MLILDFSHLLARKLFTHQYSFFPKQFQIWALVLILILTLSCGSKSDPITETFQLGTDGLFDKPYFSLIKGKRIGLISNHTGVGTDLVHTAVRMDETESVELVALFGPEHGFSGSFQAGEIIESGPRVYSLYGEQRAPTEEMLSEIDILVYDIQDVGARFYTYTSTLFESLKAAGEKGIPFIVLDRPNPLTGQLVEGPIMELDYRSFVGIYSIPIRYGITIGELARFFNSEAALNADLTVVPMQGWSRQMGYPIDKLQWISPSPNMPTIRTAELYPGFCLIEGTNLSEGRGTTQPFELVGAPWLDAEKLVRTLNDRELPGVYFRPQRFTPTFSKHKGLSCPGFQIHVLDHRLFKPVYSALFVISEILKQHPESLEFRESHFDRLIGNGWVRTWLQEGKSVDSMVAEWEKGTEEFRRKSQQYYLY